MFILENLVQPETITEAYQTLTSSKNNAILGGCAYLKLGSKKIQTGIDLSRLALNTIEEQEDYIVLGAMVTFRDIETNELLNQYFNRLLPRAVSPVIGVQFRNIVTVGASVYSKYGFSDLITAMLALDTDVELYHSGRMSLKNFLAKPLEQDILTRIFIKKNNRVASYQDFRNSASDYAILNAAVSVLDGQWRIVVGARPLRAEIAVKASEILSQGDLSPETIDAAAEMAAEELVFGSNLRGSAEYRKALCKVLVKRGIMEVL